MNILFVHQNFPGQFRHLAPALSARGHRVIAMTTNDVKVPSVECFTYKYTRGSSPNIFPLAADIETKFIRADSAAMAMSSLRDKGFIPDVIVGHPGWGEMHFARDVFPHAKQLHFLEFFYDSEGTDYGFDPEFTVDTLQDRARIRAKNASLLMSLNDMDRAYSPTEWQKSTFPQRFQSDIEVIFDGIDTDLVSPTNPDLEGEILLKSRTGEERCVRQGGEVITFVNRNLEPYRGYHVFMRALPEIQRQRPNAITIIVGGNEVSYGKRPQDNQSWRDIFLHEVKDRLDLSRVFFLGKIPYANYLNLLKVSSCHVYLTYPFVLSWSCVEAMAMGCVVVGSATQPVQEVIEDGINGLLVDFFDVDGLAHRVADVLANQDQYKYLRMAARKSVVENYDLKRQCLPRQIKLVESMC